MSTEAATDDARARLALALDVDDLVEATRLARQMKDWFGVAKVGLELYTAAGPDAIGSLMDLGYEVFCDLKLYDIPNTVERTAHVLGALGVTYLTLHAHGGQSVLQAGVEGLAQGADNAGLPAPKALAVTVLTSDADAPPHIMPKRAAVAVEAGCQGIVCAAEDLGDARQLAPRLIRVVPGIRPEGSDHHDQSRAATPGTAIRDGADLLVIGRPVTQADDPAAAASAIAAEVTQALEG
jgi:orotidine-5'-phosphate decarboxylase